MDKDLLKLATYTDINVGLIQSPYSIRSISKIVFIAFCVYYQGGKRYNKLDIMQTFFSTLSGKLLAHIDDLEIIIRSIMMLEKSGIIKVDENGMIVVSDNLNVLKCHNSFLKKFSSKEKNNPILSVNLLDDRAFMEEVVRYV